MRVLFVGDIVGRPGREAVFARVPGLRSDYDVDYVIANAENAAAGLGATPEICEQLLEASIDLLTTGNHVYAKRELENYLTTADRVLRPANFPVGAPGRGYVVLERDNGPPLAVINLQGTVFMESLTSPFEVGPALIADLRAETPVILIDFHAEATAEKIAFAYYVDGKCSAVIGTHTHVQTADERILPRGTAFISDVGMTGPDHSVIGMSLDLIDRRFVRKMPKRFEVAGGHATLCAVVIDIDDQRGTAVSIRRIQA